MPSEQINTHGTVTQVSPLRVICDGATVDYIRIFSQWNGLRTQSTREHHHSKSQFAARSRYRELRGE